MKFYLLFMIILFLKIKINTFGTLFMLSYPESFAISREYLTLKRDEDIFFVLFLKITYITSSCLPLEISCLNMYREGLTPILMSYSSSKIASLSNFYIYFIQKIYMLEVRKTSSINFTFNYLK